MKRHPEQRDGEVYIGNVDLECFSKSDWCTKRLGVVARYSDGSEINSSEGLRPMFVTAHEVQEALAVAHETYDIEALRDLLKNR